jgi:hypothetical protein
LVTGSDPPDPPSNSGPEPAPPSGAGRPAATIVGRMRYFWRARSKRAKQAFGAAGAVIAVLVGLTTLFDWFGGKVTDPPAKPPRTIDASIEMAELQLRNETLIDYLRDTNQNVPGLTQREKREKGLRFVIRVRLRGLEGTKMPLLWQMYDQRAGARLRDPIYEQIAVDFTPENQDHARTVPLWLPYPPRPGRFIVRFSLLDPKRQPLDEETVAFAVRSVPRI